jgi:hypothetical protein
MESSINYNLSKILNPFESTKDNDTHFNNQDLEREFQENVDLTEKSKLTTYTVFILFPHFLCIMILLIVERSLTSSC